MTLALTAGRERDADLHAKVSNDNIRVRVPRTVENVLWPRRLSQVAVQLACREECALQVTVDDIVVVEI